MIAITGDHLAQRHCGLFLKRLRDHDRTGGVVDRQLLHCKEAIPITKLKQIRMWRMTGKPNGVCPEHLDLGNILFHLLICQTTAGSRKIFVPHDTMKDYTVAIQDDIAVPDFEVPNSDGLIVFVVQLSVALAHQHATKHVEIGTCRRPKLDRPQRNRHFDRRGS